MKFLKNARLFGKITDIGIENGKIAFLGKTDEEGLDLGGLTVYPGLIDVHAHGCLGIDVMDKAELDEMARFLLEHGTTTWYPTTMTMPYADIVRAAAKPSEIKNGSSIPGVHLEGPFINVKYKGAQNPDYILEPTSSLLDDCPTARMITVAPEIPGALEFIEQAAQRGLVVSLGHTDTDYDTAMAAFEAGARCLTHTFNAMNGIHHRAPGPILAAVERTDVYAQLISDGLHVHPASVRMLIKLFGDDRIVLISDSMAATGYSDGDYDFGGMTTYVRNGVARTEGGNLAGSTSTLFDCVKKLISFGIEPDKAVKMATENPAEMMGLNKGRVAVGYDADLIVVDESFNLVRVIARGEF
jgi:N-acetylglucosamine-6-phosphate deacetylase